MTEHALSVVSVDSELRPWLEAANEVQSADRLERLLQEHVEPLIREIVGYQFHVFLDGAGRTAQPSESEDVCSEVRLHLLAKLHDLKLKPSTQGIRNLRSYVAVTAYRACYEYLRRKYPRRYGLKHKVRFILNQHPQFTLWANGRQHWLAGMTNWTAPLRGQSKATPAQLSHWLNEPQQFITQHQLTGKTDAVGLTQMLTAIFTTLQQPVELDDLVNVIAALGGIKDQVPLTESAWQDEAAWLAHLTDQGPDLSDTLARRSHLARLWQELRQMSPRHCSALLLNLRDEKGGSVTELLVYTGVASFSQIATTLALSETELAELWPGLPLDDLTIAARLGLTRQQIINLRRSARERLWRKLNALP